LHQEFWNIREMCDQFNVTPRTLRFYESKELLFPTRQDHKRLFTKRCRGRLKLILRGKRFGFSLEDIRQLLEMYNMGDKQQTQFLHTCILAKKQTYRFRRPARQNRRDNYRIAAANTTGKRAYQLYEFNKKSAIG